MAVKTAKPKPMGIRKIRAMAKQFHIETKGVEKLDLVRNIQKSEGNTPCYGTSQGSCEYTDCCFIGDCYKEKA